MGALKRLCALCKLSHDLLGWQMKRYCIIGLSFINCVSLIYTTTRQIFTRQFSQCLSELRAVQYKLAILMLPTLISYSSRSLSLSFRSKKRESRRKWELFGRERERKRDILWQLHAMYSASLQTAQKVHNLLLGVEKHYWVIWALSKDHKRQEIDYKRHKRFKIDVWSLKKHYRVIWALSKYHKQ